MAALAETGLATSVGVHAPTACAAIRAGTVRPQPIESVAAFDGEAPDDGAVNGHPAAFGLTAGYQVPARWMRLARAAVEDAGRRVDLFGETHSALWLCLPAGDAARFEDGIPEPRWFQQRLPSTLGGRLPEAVVSLAGTAGFWAALGGACQRLDRRELVRAVIVAADSYLDEQSLRWLSAAGRLKAPDRPSGLAPGEAGVCLVLERAGDVTVSAPPSGVDAQGGSPWKAIESAVLAATSTSAGAMANVIGNQNGEEARAYAWGMAQTSLLAKGVRLGSGQRLPAVSVGDVGLCAPALSLAVAMASYRRRYAAPGATLVWSLDGGWAGAAVVDSAGVERR